MSSYEDYTATAGSYDRTRRAFGCEVILGSMIRAGLALGEVTLLDAGCGTGNYAAALSAYVKRIEAVDASSEMLARARAKLGANPHVAFHQAPINRLPLADASVDAAMINQVLHHLPVEPGWAAQAAALSEVARVLRPGGVLTINTCSAQQLRRGCWYYPLIPRAFDECERRHVPLEALEDLLVAAGLEPRGRFVPTDAVLLGAAYADPRGPLDPHWRSGDSVWSLAGKQELRAALLQIEQLDRNGQLEAFVSENDCERLSVGQTTFVCAMRASAADTPADAGPD